MERFKSGIHKSSTRTYPGAVINSDHDLVLCDMILKLRTQKAGNSNRVKYDVEKLSNVKTCLEYGEELEKKLKYIDIDTLSTDKTYTIIAESITSTAQQVLGKYRKKIQPWITDDILDVCDKRRELKAMKNNSDKLKDEYRKVHNLIRRSMKKAKEDWLEKQYKEIDYDLSRVINSKKAYTTLKLITNSSSKKHLS